MIEAFWIPLLPPYLIGLVLSFAVEALLTPRPVAPWRRPMAAVGVHVGVWTVAFALELMLFRRPYFAVANVLAIELLIVLVSNAKYQALREPFVYPDFEYFLDAVKHPRLYLPFFGVGRALIAGGGYSFALWTGLILEDSVTAGAGIWLISFAELPQKHMLDPTLPVVLFFVNLLILGGSGILTTKACARRLTPMFNAVDDVVALGLVGALTAYRREERQSFAEILKDAPFSSTNPGVPEPVEGRIPADLVIVQSESFFDARRQYPALKRQLLENFDQLKAESAQCGRLWTSAWGANTVRSEFSFLSGMKGENLRVHQYNPYRRLAAKGFPTLASYLKLHGYRTVCVHPYHPSFYGRDKVLPNLGFDEFISLSSFHDAECVGPYVSDRAVGDKILKLLQREDSRPIYIHAITMENHGPLHLESVTAEDANQISNEVLPPGCEDLVAYARHLRNADSMFGNLKKELSARERPSSLCIFGDHVPIMPSVYEALGSPDGATDYLIWNSRGSQQSHILDREVAEISRDCLRVAFGCASEIELRLIAGPGLDLRQPSMQS